MCRMLGILKRSEGQKDILMGVLLPRWPGGGCIWTWMGSEGNMKREKKLTVTSWGGSAITKFASGLFKSWGRSMHASDPTPV